MKNLKLKVMATLAAALMSSVAIADTTIAFMRAGPDPFYQYGMEAAQTAADKLGIELVTYNANYDSAQELANVQDAVTKGVDGILIYGVSLSSERAAIAQANRGGIPIFFQYGYAPELLEDAAGFMQIDIGTFGAPVGEWVGQQLPEGEVAIVTGKLGRGDAEAYSAGFKSGLKASGSNAVIVAEQPGDWNRQQALDSTSQILTAHPNVGAIYVQNEDMGVGASIAIERAGKTGEILLVSGNGAPYGLDLIREGKLDLTNANPPSIASVMALRLLLGVIEGDIEMGKYYGAPTQILGPNNVDEAIRWDAPDEMIEDWLNLPLPEPTEPPA